MRHHVGPLLSLAAVCAAVMILAFIVYKVVLANGVSAVHVAEAAARLES